MSMVGYKGKNHPQQVDLRGALDEVDDRGTHPNDFNPLNERFGFTLDVAAAPHNAKCERYFTRADDGLEQPWIGERVWCNPPYSKIGDWVQKAHFEWVDGAELIVMLLPANRTEQGWWQDLVEPWRTNPAQRFFRVEFLRGRMRFIKAGQAEIGPNERPPFGCCLLIWSRTL
jgi:phage N-6-adenine-methyltransferase